MGQPIFRFVTRLSLIVIILIFKSVSNYLQQYPQHPEAIRAGRGDASGGKRRVQELILQQSSRVDADQLLNLDCEVFPFIFEMGVDAFCVNDIKVHLFFFVFYSNIEHQSKHQE